VREKAFEPALEAALNMNEAMGGGPEGLQSTIIQVGKALNDPIKGVTALRRVGVQLSSRQEDQIKTLIEQNDLYGAQQIILDELSTQFGGRFAAAGKTAEGSQAALADRIEDVQKALAGPLIPAIDRVRDKLIDFLGTDRVIGGAEKLGGAIAGLFTDSNIERGVGMVEGLIDKLTTGDFSGMTAGIGNVTSAVAGLPWESIADAARLLGTGSKALLDAFLGLPGWVQTAVLTGWGLNKLTGGALGGIVGELGKGLIKGVLNMNAGVVNVNGKIVNGPGGGVPGGGGGGLLGTLKGLGALASIPLAGAAATMSVDFVGTASTQMRGVLDKLEAQPRRTADEIDDSIENVEGALRAATDGPLATMVSNTTGLTDRLEAELAELKELRYGTDSIDRNMLVTADRIMQQKAAIDQAKAAASSDAAMIIGATGALGPRIDRVANTPHNVTANVDTFVNVNANIGVSVLGQTAYRTRTIYNRSSESTNTAGY
jgi:hypothetical protein